MKQKKTIKSQTKTSNRNYFNPYESVSRTNQQTIRRKTTGDTYQAIRPKKPVQKLENSTGKKQQVKGQSAEKRKREVISKAKKRNRTQNIQRTEKKVSPSTRKQSTSVHQMTPEQRRMQMRKKIKMSKKQQIKLKRRRQIQSVFRIVLAMCLTIGIVWGGIGLKEFLTKPVISYQTVKMGTLDTSTVFEGVVFRNEKIVTSEDTGYPKYIVAEGEKVEKGATIYVLEDEENLATTTIEKEEVESKVYKDSENKEALSNHQDYRYNLDQEVKSKFETFYKNRYESSTNNIYALRTKLDSSIMNRKDFYIAEQEATNQEIITLKKEIEANLQKYQKGQAVAESGVISYHMDGYETEDAKQVINGLDYQAYRKYKKALTTTNLMPSKIQKEDPIYKLVSNNEWYIVTYIDVKEDQWTQGKSYTLHFENPIQKSISFTLESKKEEENRMKLVFKSTNQIGNFLSARDIQFSIGDKEVTGLKIPTEAIVELNLIKIPSEYVVTENNVQGIYRQKDKVTEFVPIDVQDKTEENYYVVQDLGNAKTIQLKDILVQKEAGATYEVNESEVATGVYVINSQVAKFRKIEVLSQNEAYALVQYNASSQLKEMDKIISNPKSIKKDQLLEDMKVQNE